MDQLQRYGDLNDIDLFSPEMRDFFKSFVQLNVRHLRLGKIEEHLKKELTSLEATYEKRKSCYTVMCTMLSTLIAEGTDTSDEIQNLKRFLGEKEIKKFYTFVREILYNFLESLKEKKGEYDFEMEQLPLSLCKCLVNLTLTPDGARQVLNSTEGDLLLDTVLLAIWSFLQGQADHFLKVLLEFVNYVGLNGGYRMLKKKTILTRSLTYITHRDIRDKELVIMALRMLDHLTSFFSNIHDYILQLSIIRQRCDLEFWANSDILGANLVAEDIIKNFRNGAQPRLFETRVEVTQRESMPVIKPIKSNVMRNVARQSRPHTQ